MEINIYILWERVSKIALTLPGVYEKLCFGTPSFYVEKKFFTRIKEDGETLVLYNKDRDEWIATNPDVFFFTDHYKKYPILLVNLRDVATPDLKELLITSWKIRSSKTLLKAYTK